MESGVVADGTIAQDHSQMRKLWMLRETITEGLTKAGAVYKYDISLPQKEFCAIISDLRQRLPPDVKVVGYGHVGDGNLHLNVSAPEYSSDLEALIEPWVFEWTGESFSSC